MEKVLHLACGDSAAATIRESLRRAGRGDGVAAFPCGLRYGALFRDFGDGELRRYCADVERLTGCGDIFARLRGFVDIDFCGFDKVAVWHGDDVDERLFFCMACALGVGAHLYEVCAADAKGRFKGCLRSVSSACCSVEDMGWLYGRMAPVTEPERVAAAAEWNFRRMSEAPLRVIADDGGIAEAGEDYCDGAIIAACGRGFRHAARVAGEALCDTGFAVGDGFLHRRIMVLLRQGRLVARRNDVPAVRGGAAVAAAAVGSETVGGVDVSRLGLFSISVV